MRADTRWMVSIFGEGEAFAAYVDAHPTLSVAYYPSIDTWNGRDKLQINIQSYF